MQRVIAYVDGLNLYHGLRSKKWKRYYWLDIHRVAELMLKPGQSLVRTKYFTTVVKDPPEKKKRQTTFLDALGTLQDFDIYYGYYLSNDYTCWQCGHTREVYHEKMTDVNIATELLSDAFQDKFDTALLYSGDGDLVPPIRAVIQLFPKKRVVVAFPPNRVSKELKRVATAYTKVPRAVLAKSVFPDQVTKPDGFVLQCPKEWT
jgi:uncharacterized LabA/DUF88 family protein